MNRSEISKRTWRERKRSVKTICPFCKKPVFAGGTVHNKHRYHKTCLRFSKAGLTRKQSGVSNPISYKVAVKIAGEPGWSYNALRFATKEEADLFGRDLFSRWMLMEKYEVQPSDESVDATIVSGELKMLKESNPRPPAGWWADMMPRIRAQYPRRSPGSLRKILGGIWWNYPETTRRQIIREYDRSRNPILATLGTAAVTGLGWGAGFVVASKAIERRK